MATTTALILAGWWFFEQRQTYPHAQLEQTLQVLPVKGGLIAVEAHVQFENKGMTRIELKHANVKLQNVSDQPYLYGDLAALKESAYWNAKRGAKTGYPSQFNEGELRWPVLNQFDGNIDHVIEPGENDLIVFTFLVRCQDLEADNSTKLHFVRVATDVTKPIGSGPNDFVWKARAFANVSNACSGKGGIK